jgi:hypothetical protein
MTELESKSKLLDKTEIASPLPAFRFFGLLLDGLDGVVEPWSSNAVFDRLRFVRTVGSSSALLATEGGGVGMS